MRVVIHRDFPFLEQWKSLHASATGKREDLSPVKESLRRLIDAWHGGEHPTPSPGLAPLASGSAVPYDLGGGYSLLTLRTASLLVVYQVGTVEEVRCWLEAHPNVLLVALVSGGKTSLTVLGDVEITDLEVPDGAGPEDPGPLDPSLPLLPRIGGIDWKREIGHGGLAKRFLSFSKSLDPEELNEALEELERRRPELADLILRVIYHLMDDRVDQARAAVAAYLGQGEVVRLGAETPWEPEGGTMDGLEDLVLLDRLGPAELDRLLDPKRFQAWMQFLHPEQRKKVEEDYDHPVVLRGVSGSGKTVVLVHRARRLALADPNSRVLLTTLNHDLAILLKTLVDQLAGTEDLSNLHVYSFTGYLRTVVDQYGFDEAAALWTDYLRRSEGDAVPVELGRGYRDEVFAPRKDWDYQNLFHDFLSDPRHGCPAEPLRRLRRALDRKVDAAVYLREETDYVRSVDYCHQDYRGYLEVERRGRSAGLNRKQREDVLSITRAWERFQWSRGCGDPLTLSQLVFLLLERASPLPDAVRCEHLLVDEFQDLSTLELKLLARVPRAEANGLFVAGDDAQRISVKHLHLPETPLGHRSYRRAIFKNYRNTRDILEAGTALLQRHGKAAGAQGGGDLEILEPDYDERRGPKPALVRVPQPLAAAWDLAVDRSRKGIQPCTICLATANSVKLPVESLLRACPAQAEADVLSGEYLQFPDRFVVSDIAGIKGFEFTHLILLGVEEGMFPRPGSPKEERWRDALRLYAAITRGRDEVHIIFRGSPSPLVKDIQDRFERKPRP